MADLWYTSVERIYDIEPSLRTLSSLSSAQIVTVFAQPAEAEIHAAIAHLYTVPIVPAPPILVAIADDIAVYRILSRRVFNRARLKESAWPDRFKESLDTLKNIAKGELTLTSSAGNVIGGRTDGKLATSTTLGYHQTFHEGPFEEAVQDPDKIRDISDERGDSVF